MFTGSFGTALTPRPMNSGFRRNDGWKESWFTASRKADKRIASVAAWEKATTDDPLCALEIAWLPTHLSAGQITERIFDNVGATAQQIRSSDDLARLVINNRNGTTQPPEEEEEG